MNGDSPKIKIFARWLVIYIVNKSIPIESFLNGKSNSKRTAQQTYT